MHKLYVYICAYAYSYIYIPTYTARLLAKQNQYPQPNNKQLHNNTAENNICKEQHEKGRHTTQHRTKTRATSN